jgi:hypothetical protein
MVPTASLASAGPRRRTRTRTGHRASSRGTAAALSRLTEHGPAALDDAGAEILVEVADVSADLVEDERQGKGEVLALNPGVAGEYAW